MYTSFIRTSRMLASRHFSEPCDRMDKVIVDTSAWMTLTLKDSILTRGFSVYMLTVSCSIYPNEVTGGHKPMRLVIPNSGLEKVPRPGWSCSAMASESHEIKTPGMYSEI